MRIAFVKQDVYPDLYVCSNRAPIEEILFSSMMRVGPLGLFSRLDADYIIVKEDKAKECQIWKKTLSKKEIEISEEMKYKTINKVIGQEFKRPGVDICQGDLSVPVDEIDWGKYDIVLCINIAVPTRIVAKYPKVLWCHMPEPCGTIDDGAYYGYDLCLNQMARGDFDKQKRVLDFPYTFLGDDDLEKIVEKHCNISEKKKSGIFGEINCVTERPVRHIPQFDIISKETGEKVCLHKQLIKENLIEIYSSKYFLKVGGRYTRGNGAVEAISLGTPVLMSPLDITFKAIIPTEAWVFTQQEAIEKINYLNDNEDAYVQLLEKERQLLDQFIYRYPLMGLFKAFESKNGSNCNRKYSYIRSKVKRKIGDIL